MLILIILIKDILITVSIQLSLALRPIAIPVDHPLLPLSEAVRALTLLQLEMLG